jgi:short-subunit dehydrogenase
MKTVLITGASRGIGLAFTKALAKKSFNVIATCLEPEHATALKDLSATYPSIRVKKLDINDDRQLQGLVSVLNETPIDWLINNAGITGEQGVTIGNIERANFLKVFEVNCLSTRHSAPIL